MLHRPPHQKIARNHPGTVRLLLARLPTEFFLQNVARVLRGVRRDPHIYWVREPSARPPVRVEPDEVQDVGEAPAVRLTCTVSAEQRNFIVRPFQREELHLLRVVLSTQRAVLQGRVVTRILKRGHYLGHRPYLCPLAQVLDQL